MFQDSEIRRIAVYCASSTQIDQKYFAAAERLAEEMARADKELVFGAGKMGLMGKLADTMIREGGKLIGVIPEFMIALNWHHPQCTELIVTKDMAERKTVIWQRSDALVALPGGVGTLDELTEVLSLKQLGIVKQPIVILNTDGYYDGLVALLDRFIEEQFLAPVYKDMYRVVSKPEEVLPALLEQDHWTVDLAKKHTHI